MSSTSFYPISQATVLSQSPDTNSLTVMLRDGQGLAYPIPVLVPGPCDALRIKTPPLPGRGTLGIVAFVNNDIRSAVWLGAIPGGIPDAISSGNDPFLDYHAHWSGYWHSLDSQGSENTYWPDGSNMVVGSGFSPTRHIQAANGLRTSVPVAASDRPPQSSPMPFTFTHATGTKIEVDSAGDVIISGVGSISASGTTINAHAASQANITAPVVKISNGGTTQFLVTATAWNYLTTHTHSGVQTGGGNTGTPNSVPTSGVLTSVLAAQ